MPMKADCYDAETKEPICRPLHSLEELYAWRPGNDEFCLSSTPLASRVESVGGRPRTLVCHDMAGGYLEDRFVQGSRCGDAYRFYHWQYVDTFVYFSHHFISIPPPGWVNAAHKHGVPILGTLITEWDDGRERCEQFLQTEEAYMTLAERLIEIAAHYGFDGWLINIENKIEPEKVYNLVDFVRRLTERIHYVIPNSQVVWYDSVISTGELKWQNELNDKNSGFFDSCDTIFLNYCWDDDHLRRTANYAENRCSLYDAFVGVDVFGRNCRGGGGFNTKEAVQAARNNQLSVAIFAQGWVYEKEGKENFTQNENRFWMLLHDLCVPHSSVNFPFWTSFCQGQGQNYFYHGKVARQGPWTNLTLQSQQPTHTNAQFAVTHQEDGEQKEDEDEEEEESRDEHMRPDQSIEIHTEQAFRGGTCLRLTGAISPDEPILYYRLFDANSMVSGRLYVSYTYRVLSGNKADLFLDLRGRALSATIPRYYKWRCLVLVGEQSLGSERLAQIAQRQPTPIINGQGGKAKHVLDERGVLEVKPLPNDEVAKLFSNFQCHSQSSGWTTRHYLVDSMEGFSLSHIQVAVVSHAKEDNNAQVLLGQIQIMDAETLTEVPLITDLHITDVEATVEQQAPGGSGGGGGDQKQWLTLTLRWTFPADTADHFCIYQSASSDTAGDAADFSLIGHSHLPIFRVTQLPVTCAAKSPLFKVVPVLRSGLVPLLSQVPSVMCEQQQHDSKDGERASSE